MKHQKAARRYAMALMGVAEEVGAVDRIAGELEVVARAVRSSRELQLLLANPVVSPPKKRAIIREIFASRTGRETLALVELLISRHREAILAEAVVQFLRLRDEMQGIVNVDVTSVVDLAPRQQDSLTRQLKDFTGKNVRMRTIIDPSIMGGLLMQIGDTVLDASVRHQLELLRRTMLEGSPGTR